ncbi:GPW/gp25 family protein [Pelotomaculum sp. PtaB.Bin117]|uniref:GPW/gp25 family protein n=1 Tax=Pelotomaculum sp. PtaB.Bin117 TaxID=1811694 RepID=UPI00257A87F3|nr:GPW/gp25 family protein [Pelotomaculum sp. PtaB.Bin117]
MQVDPVTGRIMMSEYEEDISEAIRIILSTAKGERVMRPGFGCDIHKYIFGLTDVTSLRLLESDVKDAIMLWEPRVDDVEVNADFDRENPGKLLINIQYVVRTTNNLFNLVYPFYIYEGTK